MGTHHLCVFIIFCNWSSNVNQRHRCFRCALNTHREWIKRLSQWGEYQLHIRPHRRLGGAPSRLNSSAEPSKRLMPRRSQGNIKGGDENDYKWEMTHKTFLTNHGVFRSVSSRTHTLSLRLRPASVAVGCSPSWVSGSRGRKWEDDGRGRWNKPLELLRLEGIIAVILILASLIRSFYFFVSDG